MRHARQPLRRFRQPALSVTAKSTRHCDYQFIDRPIGAMAKEYTNGHRSGPHHHPRAQLMYAIQGVLEVNTDAGLWLVPSRSALWIPAGVLHQTTMRGSVALRTLYIATDTPLARRFTHTAILPASGLLHELLIRATELPIDYDPHGKAGLTIDLLLHEIAPEASPTPNVRWPQDPRLKKIGDALRQSPADPRTLSAWATAAGASSRTLSRLCTQELGQSFPVWRQQIRLLAALESLTRGTPVAIVAHQAGYATPSAFAAMFKRLTGYLPSHYARRAEHTRQPPT